MQGMRIIARIEQEEFYIKTEGEPPLCHYT